MSNHSFEKAMNQLGAAAEAQRQKEFLALRRQRIFDRIRRVFLFLITAGIVCAGFHYRQEVQAFASDKLGFGSGGGPKINAETSQSLKELQEQAAKRDNALEAITK
jgi:hypothetical protein